MAKRVDLYTCVQVCEHVEARGGYQVSYSTSLCLILSRQCLSVNLRWLSMEQAGPYQTPVSLCLIS